MGLEEEARRVMIAKNEDDGKNLGSLWDWRRPLGFQRLWDWCWYNVLGAIIGYGYRPWQPFGISIVVIFFGWWLFRRGYSRNLVKPTKEGAYVFENEWRNRLSEAYPKFNAFVYSLECFVPLVKLGMSEYWMPNANHGQEIRILKFIVFRSGAVLRLYLWFHIIAGWVLTTLWVGGVTGLVKT